MDFDDLRRDIDMECPHCNRKFQQGEEGGAGTGSADCPECGQPVPATKPVAKPKE